MLADAGKYQVRGFLATDIPLFNCCIGYCVQRLYLRAHCVAKTIGAELKCRSHEPTAGNVNWNMMLQLTFPYMRHLDSFGSLLSRAHPAGVATMHEEIRESGLTSTKCFIIHIENVL